MKGTQGIHPLFQRLQALIDDKDLKVSYVVDQLLKHYLTTEKTPKNYYQRIYKLLSGEYTEPTEAETQALTRFIHIERNTHQYGKALNDSGDIKKQFNLLRQYVYGPYPNKTQADRIFRRLSNLTPLSTKSIQTDTK